jgi:small-conductance mechanosensitive channel
MGFALAQTSEPTDAAPSDPVAAQAATPEAPASVTASDGVPTPTFDLDDPAIQEALKARAEAKEALADALQAQMDAAERQSADAIDDTSAKPSIIPKSVDEFKDLLRRVGDKLLGWLTSLKFLAQVGAIALAYVLSPIVAGIMRKKLFLFRDPPTETTKLRVMRDYIFRVGPLLRPILLVGLLIAFAVILEAVPMAGQTWLVKIAQSLAVVFLLYKAITEFISNLLIRKLAVWTLIPLALIMLFGYFDDLVTRLDSIEILAIGAKPITLVTIILLLIFGAAFFKIGNLLNTKGQTAIRSQEGMDVATQEVVAKIFQILLFAIVFIMVLSAAKIPLSGLVVIFSALSLGLGLGLQPIAANFVSGLIILFDRSVRVGDYVVLPDGQEGFVEAINIRNTVVETPDGKDIMVPNTKFTEEAYENWTHKDPRQRYEVHFTVAYDTDLDTLEGLLMPEVLKHHQVLEEPEMPDLEFRSFGENGVNMAIEFWADGIDDGPNKFTSDVNWIVWRVLRDNNIEIPFPQRVVHGIK